MFNTNLILTQDFFQLHLSPSTLTSVPYLDGEISIYEHKQNHSHLYIPPLALLNLNNTKTSYRQSDKQYLLRLSLIPYTNELRQTILQYLSHTHNRCIRSQEFYNTRHFC